MSEHWLIAYLQTRLQRQAAESLSRQLTRQLRELIRSARLPGGCTLPASRLLAQELGLGRNTVLAAYDQLQAEGYLESRQGAGTFVAMLFKPGNGAIADARPDSGLSRRGQMLSACSQRPDGQFGAFAPGVPELARFPWPTWQRCLQLRSRQPPLQWLGYQHEGGLPQLRAAISEYLYLARSVRCRPEQILIIPGAQAGLELCAKLLADPGERAWLEEPGYAGAQAAFLAAGLERIPIAVDEQGLHPPPDAPAARLIYVTPSHQYPTGVVMSLARRLELLRLAEQERSWIIEDDYDSEFCYASQPIPCLQSLSDNERVIYLGTFSKVMFPALRLAYLVVPDSLIDTFRRVHGRLLAESSYLQQAALADFIEQGHFARHIRQMRELYRLRQRLLRHALQQQLGDSLPLSAGEAGMHLVASLPDALDTIALSRQAAEQRLWLRPLPRHFLGTPDRNGLVLGYAGVEENQLLDASRSLAHLLEGRL